jgi:hypothetical protein
MIKLDAATFLLQWATGGLFFLWITTRRREVGIGYGWLLRATYLLLAAAAAIIGVRVEAVPVRDACAALVALERERVASRSARVAAMTGIDRAADGPLEGVPEFPPVLDLIAPAIGLVGLVAAGLHAGDPAALSVARTVVGAAFLGSVTDAMLLGHWYLVQPGLARGPLLELVRWVEIVWPFEILVMLWPTGMVSVLDGTIDDGYAGLLGWFWVACAVTTIVLVVVTRAALRERAYSAVMAATGLLYLAILTAFGTDLVARAVLAP